MAGAAEVKATLGLIIVALSLVACGRVGPIKPPGPASDVTYPRVYPAPDSVRQ